MVQCANCKQERCQCERIIVDWSEDGYNCRSGLVPFYAETRDELESKVRSAVGNKVRFNYPDKMIPKHPNVDVLNAAVDEFVRRNPRTTQ